ncbi:hypothetical protein PSHT_00660 [Puccinia striiformis]|uniref:Uncharacterized protein n=1 Tax=Puccinia striiformis TaxID=27350 RepID=A0A2S4WMI2_9BASI|nr:hypothetical protein PSHT_00660 [Puccinia striiformis]
MLTLKPSLVRLNRRLKPIYPFTSNRAKCGTQGQAHSTITKTSRGSDHLDQTFNTVRITS